MIINYLTTPFSNKFHVLANLTGWHFSARKQLKEYLYSTYGSLTNEQEEALNKLKELLKGVASGPNFIGTYFFNADFCEILS